MKPFTREINYLVTGIAVFRREAVVSDVILKGSDLPMSAVRMMRIIIAESEFRTADVKCCG